jgi:hypothetical protein
MHEKRYVGSFITEDEVLAKIALLKEEGHEENHIYVVTNDKDSLSIVRGQTDVDLQSYEGNWLDRFMSFLNGDDEVRNAFSEMGFSDEDSTRYYNEVKNGSILLYVDNLFGNRMTSVGKDFQTGYTDPNIGANLTVEEFKDTVHPPTSVESTEPVTPFNSNELGQRVIKDKSTLNETIPFDKANRY